MGVIGTRQIKILAGDQSYSLLKDGDYISAIEYTSDMQILQIKLAELLIVYKTVM
ncbi:hypothetical protein AGMMS49921_03740 [Endomicrobiia bacterium]|nr:hypothetical protein AGMMS49921_03740 [Endomicrobiia bacterium]